MTSLLHPPALWHKYATAAAAAAWAFGAGGGGGGGGGGADPLHGLNRSVSLPHDIGRGCTSR
jgi:hypothetical protein